MSQELELHEYQERVVQRMVAQPHLGLLLDPGLGKTAIVLEAFRRLRSWAEVSRLLVVAPRRVAYSVWPREATKWRQFSDLRVHVLHGAGRTDAALAADFDVYVTNPETLPWLAERADRWRFPEVLAVDESTKFKRITSGRSKNLRKLLGFFARRSILTGTPTPNGLIDIHGQQYILDRGATFGPHIGDFRADYFVSLPTGQGGTRHKWVPRRGTTQKIYDKLAPWVVRLDARDYLELPELVNVSIPIDLPEVAREKYKRLRDDLVLELEGGDVVATSAGALTGKCRQVANGSVYFSEVGEVTTRRTRRWGRVHDEKARALESTVEELGGKPLLVGFEYKHELTVIRERLARVVGRVPSLDGDTSDAEGVRLEKAWNRGELPVLCAHPLSAAHGLNLQEGGHHLFWYSIPWDLELYDQMVRRVWRQGQAERTFVFHAVASGTIDETVMRVLAKKSRDQQELLDALKEDLGMGPITRRAEPWE